MRKANIEFYSDLAVLKPSFDFKLPWRGLAEPVKLLIVVQLCLKIYCSLLQALRVCMPIKLAEIEFTGVGL